MKPEDTLPLSLGGGVLALPSLSDLSTMAEQVGMILGAFLVLVTLSYRLWAWYQEYKDQDKDE